MTISRRDSFSAGLRPGELARLCGAKIQEGKNCSVRGKDLPDSDFPGYFR
tara:strand:- start:393 stop:542 length:150 start_codon:yes stop_codon:yes gene_type:complete